MWWAVVTATTVGYRDAFPITPEGRAVAVVLMLTGVGIIGTDSANIAATSFGPTRPADRTSSPNA